MSGPTVAMVWKAARRSTVARTLIGPTDGPRRRRHHPRRFRHQRPEQSHHGSDSPENAATEISLWFRPEELVAYQPPISLGRRG